MSVIFVTPAKDVDAENKVAIWDQNPEHFDADPQWAELKCLWIEGSSVNPGRVYAVTDTHFVQERIRLQFLKQVDAPPVAVAAPVKVSKKAESAE